MREKQCDSITETTCRPSPFQRWPWPPPDGSTSPTPLPSMPLPTLAPWAGLAVMLLASITSVRSSGRRTSQPPIPGTRSSTVAAACRTLVSPPNQHRLRHQQRRPGRRHSYIAADAVNQAFLYSNGSTQDLGTLGGTLANSVAMGINISGQVVGYSCSTDNTAYHAFLYADGSMVDLGTLGGSHTVAVGINDSGGIVGSSLLSGATIHAFLYRHGTMQDLGTLGGTSSGASAVNNAGQIVGSSAASWQSSRSRVPLCQRRHAGPGHARRSFRQQRGPWH